MANKEYTYAITKTVKADEQLFKTMKTIHVLKNINIVLRDH